ncbi:sugar nucleotide-binding protein [Vitreoscilla massiliensis]|uniref:Sugar nucleotide-binding protein n=1 Tax=Vitreoscilla massiliensis TaxID=1689272 RepID=A0ABY4E596_9NEIS|nr:sugar nucleotide-binding protein [Vitreoscilla massiliensis]UOO90561.1 sugar nucleotide-binding protein [Vitreoscilla massiliensis]
MNILLLGSSGLIGAAVLAQLQQQGHRVCAPTSAECDLLRPTTWSPYLQQVDAIVNCVGLMSDDAVRMHTLQCEAPQALYQQAAAQGLRYVLQVSAAGADVDAKQVFLRSKGQLDAWLLSSGLKVGIVRPSLVFSPQGRSSKLFVRMAKLPHLCLPQAGQTPIQPVALNDVVAGCVQMLDTIQHGVVHAVGGEVVSLAEYVQLLRHYAWQQAPAHIHALPIGMTKAAAVLLQTVSGGLVSVDSVDMLLESRLVSVAEFAQLLGKRPQTPAQFLQAAYAQGGV